jgi:hypothetical protein
LIPAAGGQGACHAAGHQCLRVTVTVNAVGVGAMVGGARRQRVDQRFERFACWRDARAIRAQFGIKGWGGLFHREYLPISKTSNKSFHGSILYYF